MSTLAQLTQTMATMQDVLVSFGSAAPVPGDLQESLYSLKVEQPAVSGKNLNGDFSDWQSDATPIATTPVASLTQPSFALGNLFCSVDGFKVFFFQDRDLLLGPVGPDGAGHLRFSIEAPGYESSIDLTETSAQVQATAGETAYFVRTTEGIEMGFPITEVSGDWDRVPPHGRHRRRRASVFVRPATDLRAHPVTDRHPSGPCNRPMRSRLRRNRVQTAEHRSHRNRVTSEPLSLVRADRAAIIVTLAGAVSSRCPHRGRRLTLLNQTSTR